MTPRIRSALKVDESAESPLSNILDSIAAHVAILDLGGRIRLVNRAWRQFGAERGAPPNGYLGESYLQVCERAGAEGDEDALAVARELAALMNGERRRFSRPYRCSDRTFQLRATRVEHDGAAWILVTHDDVTAVTEAASELSRLAERLLEVQEEERRRIARELHDSTSQHLVALQLGLAAVRRGRATTETLDDMDRQIAEAHREIRSLSYLLHPPTLARDKLTTSLRSYADEFGRRTGVTIRLSTAGAVDALPFAIQRTLFRVVQEAMSNAYRHARAPAISIDFRRNASGVRLLIRDEGGAGPRDTPLRPGVGIAGMEARVRQHEGAFSIEATTSGVCLRAFIPANGIEAAEP